MKILIVGGVAGGASAAARLRRLDESAEITMFERGGYISFANCGLPYYIGNEIKNKSSLTLQTPEGFYARFRVDVRVNHEVVSIDRDKKTVEVKALDTGTVYTESYDKIILSPGAEPVMPGIAVKSDRVFTLRNIPDTYRIKDCIETKKPKSAVVVGGGYIGVEMAENLKNAGLDVTIVEMADQVIMPLDYETVLKSIEKTNRVVVCQEAPVRGGIASDIVAEIISRGFDLLDAPPERVGALNIPVPYNKYMEEETLPSVQNIKDAVIKTLSDA